MGFLKNLKVKKVSFVRRGANRRKFLLLKSEEPNDQLKGGTEMKELVKQKVVEILKSETDPKEVVKLLKADKDIENLQLSDEDFQEVENSLEFMKALVPEKEPVKKEPVKKAEPAPVKKAEPNGNGDKGTSLEDVLQKLASATNALAKSSERTGELEKKIEKQERVNTRRDILKWLHLECPFLPADFEKTADEILELQDVSESAAQIMKNGLQAASAALAGSDIFEESGGAGGGRVSGHIPGSELLKEIKDAQDEVRKSGDKVDEVELIRGIVNGKGRNFYLGYRDSINRRAKLAGLGPEIANYI